MIVVNGKEYHTLDDELFVNGKKVYEAYANGTLVYPEAIDPYYTYIVATGETEVELSELPTSDDIYTQNVKTHVKAKVTWIVRFRGEVMKTGKVYDFNEEYLYVNVSHIYNPDRQYQSQLFECWTFIDLDVSDGANSTMDTHTTFTDGRIRDRFECTPQGTADMISGTYKFRRQSNTEKYFTLLNYGDFGIGGEYSFDSPPLEPTFIALDDVPAFQVGLGGSSTGDKDIYISSNTTNPNYDTVVMVSFRNIGIVIGELMETELKEVYVSYRPPDSTRNVTEWIDVATDFRTLKDAIGNIVYSNNGEWIRLSYHTGYPTHPWKWEIRRRFDFSATELEIFRPGETLPSELADIGSIGYYDERIVWVQQRR